MTTALRLGFTKNPALFFMGSAAWQLSAGWAGIMGGNLTLKRFILMPFAGSI